MPLTYFITLLVVVITAAALTLWVLSLQGAIGLALLSPVLMLATLALLKWRK